jgi:hypothetical protein
MGIEDIPMTELEEVQLSLPEQLRRLRRRLNGVQVLFDSFTTMAYSRIEKQVDQLGQIASLVEQLAEAQIGMRDDMDNRHQRVMDVLGRLVKVEED